MLRLAHIINPVIVPETSDLYTAQPVTFRSMEQAFLFAQDQISVQLFSAQYPEDRVLIPPTFQRTPDLERSVLDIGQFKRQRKLPILNDILDRLYNAAPETNFLIYTNVDIGLQPSFYLTVASIVAQGYDAFVINRRTISNYYHSPEDLPLIYAETGQPHPGHDCFVFKRSLWSDFLMGEACIGAERIGKALILNMLCNANNFMEFKNLHITFHIGNDQQWKSLEYFDYDSHNNKELRKIYQHYQNQGKLPRHSLMKHCTPWDNDQQKLDYRLYRQNIQKVENPLVKAVMMSQYHIPLLKQRLLHYWQHSKR